MRLFVQAVRGESFSEAGRQLGVAPSSVSRRIGQLEESLGVRLLNRTTRRLSLTEAGRIYFERASRILTEIDETEREVADLDATPRGTLRVSAPTVFGATHVSPVVADFLAAQPELDVDLTLSDQIIDLVEEGIDVAIRIAELRDSNLVARKLMDMERVICASPEYLARRGEPRTASDLLDHDCLVFRLQTNTELWRPGGRRWQLQGPGGDPVEIPASGPLVSNSVVSLVAAARRGLGLVLVPTWYVNEDLRAGRLRAVLGDHDVMPGRTRHAVYAVYPSRRFVPAKVRAFIDFLDASIRSDQPELEAQGLRPA